MRRFSQAALLILCTTIPGLSGAATPATLPDLQGNWVAEANHCNILCSFTITDVKKGKHDVMKLQFEPGTMAEDANGVLTAIDGTRYTFVTDLSDEGVIPFSLKDGKLTGFDATTFHREKAK